MKQSRYFSLEELLDSSVARQKGISNNPSWTVVEHLNELALFLDGIREAWGSAIIVSSGFRNKKLNDAVGGVHLSAHLVGFAVDLIPANGKLNEFEAFLKNYLKDKQFDQVIWEKKGAKRWVHIGLYATDGRQRRQMFGMVVK